MQKIKIAISRMAALPAWIKGIILVQSLIPSVILWYQLKLATGQTTVLLQAMDMTRKFATTADNRPTPMSSALADMLWTIVKADALLKPVVILTFVLAGIGAVLGLLIIRSYITSRRSANLALN